MYPLAIHAMASKGWKQRGVNVDDSIGVGLKRSRTQLLHIASQNYQIRLVLL
jgi:hypothetical protein